MENKTVINNRIEWVDYFKALAIILVVIGHATSVFNKYIYQFHVAAFFFISGYVSNLNKKRIEEVVLNKIFTLWLPYTFFSLIGVSVIWIMNKGNILYLFSSISEVPGILELWKTIYTYLRCDWLGGMWFIVALFSVTILQKSILMISGKKIAPMYYMLTLFLFICAYSWNMAGYCPIPIHNFILLSIAQFYYALGIIARNRSDLPNQRKMFEIKNWHRVLLFGLNILVFYLFGDELRIHMDIAGLQVNNPVLDVFMVLNGCVFLWNIANIISMFIHERIKRVLNYIGKHTMSILILHFIGYKVVTIICAFFDISYICEIAKLCPPENLSNDLWGIYTIVAIGFSLGIWACMKKNRIIRGLVGEDREFYRTCIRRVCNNNILKGVFDVIDEVSVALGNSYNNIWGIWKKDKKGIVLIGICVLTTIICLVV